MKDIVKLIVSLGLICMFGSAALVYVHNLVEEPCRLAEQAALNDNLKLVVPKDVVNNELMKDASAGDVRFFSCKDKDGKVVAYAAESIGNGGFSGNLKVLLGLTLEGKIIAVVVTEHTETPGVGSKATDRKISKSFWNVVRGKTVDNTFPPNKYLDSFANRNVADLNSSVKLFDSRLDNVSGATYSCTAVYNAVNKVSAAFQNIQKSPQNTQN